MSLLPQPVNSDEYWRDVYEQPLAFWQPAITQIAQSHGLPLETWARVPLGRNIVFCSPTGIIKLSPPCWPGEMAREVAALDLVVHQLPVATPTLLAQSTIDGWNYNVQVRLSGTPLWELWTKLPYQAQASLAYQHGELMAAIHAIPINNTFSTLQFNWQEMITEQIEDCTNAMQASGVNPSLVAQVNNYVANARVLTEATPHVLLHGDLNHLNFLVSEENSNWQISGIIDWGDAKIGPASHEFISPGVHMYKGNQALLAQWYHGYGLTASKQTQTYEHILMVRSMLYYSDMFSHLLETVKGAAGHNDWATIAHYFWHISE